MIQLFHWIVQGPLGRCQPAKGDLPVFNPGLCWHSLSTRSWRAGFSVPGTVFQSASEITFWSSLSGMGM